MALSAILDGKLIQLIHNNDGLSTYTSEEQDRTEQSILLNYNVYRNIEGCSKPKINLHKSKHLNYLKRGLHNLSDSYSCLDASRPWLCFWILHSLELLHEPIPEETASDIAAFLEKCQHADGGFCGGPSQLPHLAPTYAAVCALCILGRSWPRAYSVIDRVRLRAFLQRCIRPSGAVTMHEDGEEDVRGAYCAVVVARLTNVFTNDMFMNTVDWIVQCQTYEGGFGGLPGLEAHGGYSFCGFAALALLGQEHKINMRALLHWVSNRQMKLEGGFQGRTNKLVDGCYSFWQGGLFPILHNVLEMHGDESVSGENWMFDRVALEEYVLVNCQSTNGGLLDKPGKNRDFYHTCYCLSGLSIAENFIGCDAQHDNVKVTGAGRNVLKPIHPIYNICVDSAADALEHFIKLPVPIEET